MTGGAGAFAHTNGPRDARIVLVGEAFGEQEEKLGVPFVGGSGWELSRMVFEAGLCQEAPLEPLRYSPDMLRDWWSRQGLLLTNVLAFRPPGNKLDSLCGKKAEVGADYPRPAMGKGGYLLPKYFPELERLRAELTAYDRTCILALGATASWALLHEPRIGVVRGVATRAIGLCPDLKVLPTYHPAGIMRNWSWRTVAVADFMKVAQREGLFAEVRRPERRVCINPTLFDVREFFKRPALEYAVDTETKSGHIKMIGFARSPSEAIVIPLYDPRKPDKSYWSFEDECEVWRCVQRACDGRVKLTGQNFLYDLQYLLRASPVRPKAVSEDTMLLSHSLFPELPKGLGFLGSIYTNEASWKLMRDTGFEELKRDE